jgi:hypothetical protein
MESETMLESGDDPNTVAAALRNIETARAKLNAKPLGVTTSSMDVSLTAAVTRTKIHIAASKEA